MLYAGQIILLLLLWACEPSAVPGDGAVASEARTQAAPEEEPGSARTGGLPDQTQPAATPRGEESTGEEEAAGETVASGEVEPSAEYRPMMVRLPDGSLEKSFVDPFREPGSEHPLFGSLPDVQESTAPWSFGCSNQALRRLSAERLRLARNEVYARRGRVFQAEDLQRSFGQQSWYAPDVDYTDGRLTSQDHECIGRIALAELGAALWDKGEVTLDLDGVPGKETLTLECLHEGRAIEGPYTRHARGICVDTVSPYWWDDHDEPGGEWVELGVVFSLGESRRDIRWQSDDHLCSDNCRTSAICDLRVVDLDPGVPGKQIMVQVCHERADRPYLLAVENGQLTRVDLGPGRLFVLDDGRLVLSDSSCEKAVRGEGLFDLAVLTRLTLHAYGADGLRTLETAATWGFCDTYCWASCAG
jgi:hypothetical protein